MVSDEDAVAWAREHLSDRRNRTIGIDNNGVVIFDMGDNDLLTHIIAKDDIGMKHIGIIKEELEYDGE